MKSGTNDARLEKLKKYQEEIAEFYKSGLSLESYDQVNDDDVKGIVRGRCIRA